MKKAICAALCAITILATILGLSSCSSTLYRLNINAPNPDNIELYVSIDPLDLEAGEAEFAEFLIYKDYKLYYKEPCIVKAAYDGAGEVRGNILRVECLTSGSAYSYNFDDQVWRSVS